MEKELSSNQKVFKEWVMKKSIVNVKSEKDFKCHTFK
jgi:hypothetical protein